MRNFLVSVTSTVTKKFIYMPMFNVRETSSFKVRSNDITIEACLAQAKNMGLKDPEINGWTPLGLKDSNGNHPTI